MYGAVRYMTAHRVRIFPVINGCRYTVVAPLGVLCMQYAFSELCNSYLFLYIGSHCAVIRLCCTVVFYDMTTPMVTRMVVIKLPISVTPVLLLAPDFDFAVNMSEIRESYSVAKSNCIIV